MIVVFLNIFGFAAIKDYVNLPVVGIDSNGECAWVEEAPDFERKDCEAFPAKYHAVHVL